jgi:hypothetical protein
MEVDIVVVRQRIAPLPQHTGFPDVSLIVTVFVFLLLLLLGALVDRVIRTTPAGSSAWDGAFPSLMCVPSTPNGLWRDSSILLNS